MHYLHPFKNRWIGIIILSQILFHCAMGQQLPDRKKNADRLYKTGNYALAIPIYKNLLRNVDLNNPNNPVDNILLLADCYRETRNYDDAEYWYHQTVMNYNAPNLSHFFYGEALQYNGKYHEAKVQFQLYTPHNRQDSALKTMKIESCNKALQLNFVPRSIAVKNVKELNTVLSDFGMTQSQNNFYFVSNRKVQNIEGEPKNKDSLYGWTNEPFWHLYQSQYDKIKGFSSPSILNATINSKYHTGPAVLNKTGDVMFFTQANAEKRHEQSNNTGLHFKEPVFNNQIFVSVKINGQWQRPIPCYFNNVNSYSVEHPALSKDDKTLYFASDMPGGKGGMDIYSVDILGGGMFGQPKNLGDSINSAGDEVFPTVGPDGTLYFSSNGKIGFGGLDLFKSTYKQNHWTNAVNLGKPINSNKDDFYILFTDPIKQIGYFSSNRDGGLGEDDIYSFQEFQPEIVPDSLKASFVYLKKNNPTVLDTLVRFFKPDTTKRWVGKNLILFSIQYQTGKSGIIKSSLPILNQIADFMKTNVHQRLLIKGFTDNIGTSSRNIILSSARANNVRDYLITQGVDPNRLEAEGYGSTQPIYKCPDSGCTEQENQANRRTEFTLIL
jgi:hypothetical protein